MTFEEITSRFDVKIRSKKSNGDIESKAICPVHNDRKPSLSITYKATDRRTIINCLAGCSYKDILAQVGLDEPDLYEEPPKKEIENSNIQAVYPYFDKNHNLIFEKVRFKNKGFSQRRYIEGDIVWGLDEGEYTETYFGSNNYSKKMRPGAKRKMFPLQQPTLYNLPALIGAIKKGYQVYIVEGEKDANTLIKLGYTATTASNGAGEGKWLMEYCDYFKGASVVILPDNDEPGKKFADEIKRKLKSYAHTIKVFTISDKPKGDITDWIEQGHSKEEFDKIINDIECKYAPWIYTTNKGSLRINEGILTESVKNTLRYILVGDLSGEQTLIYIYENGVYKNISKNTLKRYVMEYIPSSLRTNNLINNVTSMLVTGDIKRYTSLNGDKDIINFKNGLYHVKTKKFSQHSPEYISAIQINSNYIKNPINNNYWDRFINTLTGGDSELISIIQEWFGLVISNYDGALPKRLLILYGKGDTGKSKVIGILIYLVGEENSAQIAIQKLGDRFSLSRIGTVRIIHNADLPTGIIEDEALAIIKQLTGGDAISIEKKGKDSFDIYYRGVLMYGANKMPHLKGDLGEHVFNRFVIIPCDYPIPIEKQDPNILEKLKLDSEYIVQWALVGLNRFIDNNYKFTSSVRADKAKEEYSNDIDSVRAFISELYDITTDRKDRIKAKELYSSYDIWCVDKGKTACGNDEFRRRLEENLKVKYNKVYCGYPHYEYIKRKELIEVEEGYYPFS